MQWHGQGEKSFSSVKDSVGSPTLEFDEKFVPSKWIHLQSNNGGLSVPTQDFAKDLDKMNIVFKAQHIY